MQSWLRSRSSRPGTAIAVRPGLYPAGSTGSMFPQELVVIRDLAECEGVVRWGGDDKACPKEGHFQIDVLPSDGRLDHVAAKIRASRDKPGKGAGSLVDPLLSTCRAAARRWSAGRRPPNSARNGTHGGRAAAVVLASAVPPPIRRHGEKSGRRA